MLFNSFIFIFIFLPVSLILWFGFNRLGYGNLAKAALILLSLIYYGSFSVWNVPVLLLEICVNFGISAGLKRIEDRESGDGEKKQGTGLMIFGVVFNLLFLCAFKYASSYESLLADILPLSDTFHIPFPVGISFYTFSQISFIVDRYRGKTEHDSFLNYVLSCAFFPKLAEGPITFYNEIGPQFHDSQKKVFCPENFARGLVLFTLGMAKKVLIADRLSSAASFGFANAYYLDTLTVCCFLAAYTFQLYFDFSGYIDMATGVAKMFNIEFPVNFDTPFQAVSFSNFWQRWHMTLTRFFTQYVYIPLGGSRKGRFRTAVNVMIVFILSGIWHGTGWTYLYWGVFSGIFVILFNSFFKDAVLKAKKRITRLLLRIVNFILFAFTLIFFGAGSIDYSFAILRRLFYPTFPGFLYRMADTMNIPELYVVNEAVSLYAPSYSSQVSLEELICLLALCIALVSGRDARRISEQMTLKKRHAFLIGILFAWCLFSLQGVSTFLYFQF